MDLNDEVVRGSIILKDGELLWPPPPPKVAPAPPTLPSAPEPVATDAKLAADKKEAKVPDYFRATLKDSLLYTAGNSNIVACFLFVLDTYRNSV